MDRKESEALEAAKNIAQRANLRIVARRNSAGQVINYKLYRTFGTRLAFLGERANAVALAELATRCARTESGKVPA